MSGLNTHLDTLDWLQLDTEPMDAEVRKAYEQAVAEGRAWEFLEALKLRREASTQPGG